jgi:alanyl-tRNA synthetase
MERQREQRVRVGRARSRRRSRRSPELADKRHTRFLGYDTLESSGCRVAAIIVDQRLVDEIGPGGKVEVILDETPFYAEAGGQVGDSGSLWSIETGREVARVETTYPAIAGLTAHRIVAMGTLRWDRLRAGVDPGRGKPPCAISDAPAAHRAAEVLGAHVKQAGSVVNRALRFDFTHYGHGRGRTGRGRTAGQRTDPAQHRGADGPWTSTKLTTATALFGEKYGDTVRVVSVPGFS